jgi:benzylsuccinate CoA-transferase BbsF subunit
VLDFTWYGVGPLATKYLADNGAEVIKVESRAHPDGLRLAPPWMDGIHGLNRSQFHGSFNTSKKSICLNLATERGRELVLEMVPRFDVVAESFTAGTMKKWGLSYPDLCRLRPDLIQLSTCMQGQTGPLATYPGFGNLMAALTGFYEITGMHGGEPLPPYGAYTDFIAQRYCALAVCAALDVKRRTGKGQYIDVSQYEAALQNLGPELLDFTCNGREATRMGNADRHSAPHGVYPCAGEDRWIAIACRDEAEWQQLERLMGQPAWAAESRFATREGRKQHEADLDRHIAQWTAGFEVRELFHLLAPHLPTGIVHDQSGLYTDAQVLYRDYFIEMEHAVMGKVPYTGPQATFSRADNRPTKPSPALGEHSRLVLERYLGLSTEEIDALVQEGAVEVFEAS